MIQYATFNAEYSFTMKSQKDVDKPQNEKCLQAVRSNLQPLLLMLEMSPMNLTKFDEHKTNVARYLTIFIKILFLLSFISVCVHYCLVLYNAATQLSYADNIDRVVQMVSLLLLLTGLCELATIFIGIRWFSTLSMHRFLVALSQVTCQEKCFHKTFAFRSVPSPCQQQNYGIV
jgi:hypothetical protein